MNHQSENDFLPPLLSKHRNNLIENCRQAPDNFFDDFPPFILGQIRTLPPKHKLEFNLWWPVSAVAAVGLVFLILQVAIPKRETLQNRVTASTTQGIADDFTASEIGLHDLEYFLADELSGDASQEGLSGDSEEYFSDYDLWLLHQPEYELLTLQTEL